jgi:hypothetical protein
MGQDSVRAMTNANAAANAGVQPYHTAFQRGAPSSTASVSVSVVRPLPVGTLTLPHG